MHPQIKNDLNKFLESQARFFFYSEKTFWFSREWNEIKVAFVSQKFASHATLTMHKDTQKIWDKSVHLSIYNAWDGWLTYICI